MKRSVLVALLAAAAALALPGLARAAGCTAGTYDCKCASGRICNTGLECVGSGNGKCYYVAGHTCTADGECASGGCSSTAKTCCQVSCGSGVCMGDNIANCAACSTACPTDANGSYTCSGNACKLACNTGYKPIANVCTLDPCNNNAKDTGESDTDCGGADCTPCGAGRHCNAASDCAAGVCNASNLCVAAGCTDGVKNGEETDTDCGGSCAKKCANAKKCKLDSDCQSTDCCLLGITCSPLNTCVATGCSNGVKDDEETDTDCGGDDCWGCLPGQRCVWGNYVSDCRNYPSGDDEDYCKVTDLGGGIWEGTCPAVASCTDLAVNGSESDTDCGGTKCAKCTAGQHCNAGSDCASGSCESSACAACAAGLALCGGACCAEGETCVSGTCISGECLAVLPGSAGLESIPLKTDVTDAACRLQATSLAQSSMDNQSGEDQSFFMQEQMAPSLLLMIDTGKSMLNLPMDPGCSASPGCNSVLIDSYFDMTMGTDPTEDGSDLFKSDKWYVGAGDNVNIDYGCTTVKAGYQFDSGKVQGKDGACAKATGDTAMTSAAYKDCVMCLSGTVLSGAPSDATNVKASKGYYLAPNGARAYSGRFLNVFPPKCVQARKLLLSDTLVKQTKVRYSVAVTLETSGDKTKAEESLDFLMSGFQPNQCTKIIASAKPPPAYVGAVQKLDWGGKSEKDQHTAKPLAEALWRGGQFLQDEGNFFSNAFGADWADNTPHQYNTNTHSDSGAGTHVAWCSTCQKSALVLITDGVPDRDDSLPKSDSDLAAYKPYSTGAACTTDASCGAQSKCVSGTCWTCKTDSKGCWDKKQTDRGPSYLPSVAAMLNDSDLRTDFDGKQVAQTYIIGLGTSKDLLRSSAVRGGGEFFTAYSEKQLKEALEEIITNVSSRAMSVAAPSLSTLQTKSGSAMVVPRFIPSKAAAWEGELYKFTVFSEFAAGCVESACSATGCTDGQQTLPSGKKCVCHGGKCDGMYTLDKNLDFVGIDDSDGSMIVLDVFGTWGLDGVPKAKAGPIAAVPYWSAGEMLHDRAPSDRKIYTVIDDKAPLGKIDAADSRIEFDYTNDDTVTALIPYLGLGTKINGSSVCDRIAAALSAAGTPISGFNEKMCAKAVIAFVRGQDTLNETFQYLDASTYPQDAGKRNFALGDIFHSSPIRVDPPVPQLPLCDRGFHNQCTRSLYATDTDNDVSETCGLASKSSITKAYDYYVEKHRKRPAVMVVGANDGMLHAFQLSCYKGDNATTGVAEFYEGSGFSDASSTCASGVANGTELWAFIPPDLLPRLAETMVGAHHPYMVDATPMVRDVWVDGSGSPASADAKKQCDEFHTMLIFGERRGGTHYTALDITDVADPKFRWMFPQIGTPEELTMGESWSDYLPGAPPIGPVKLAKGAAEEERWVVMFGGGYDPRRVRGNQVYMADAWSGTKLWEARYAGSGPTKNMIHSFAATPAMVAWGSEATTPNFDFNKNFFDTAVIGDIGGQVWVARFHEPGVLATNPYNNADAKIATNWRIARGFEEERDNSTSKGLLVRPPFFSMAATVRMSSSAALRAYLGTGDRYNLRQWDLGYCTLDDPIACARASAGNGFALAEDGTTHLTLAPVGTKTVEGVTANTYYASGTDHYNVSWTLTNAGVYTRTESLTWNNSTACGDGPKVGVSVNIGNSLDTGWASSDYAPDAKLRCTVNADGALECDAKYIERGYIENNLDETAIGTIATNNPKYFNRFLGFQVFDDSPRSPKFSTDAEALAYDAARLTEADTGMRLLDPYDAPSPTATEGDKGWYLFYPGLDERTATNTTVFNGCAMWSTVQASSPCTTVADCTSSCADNPNDLSGSKICKFGNELDENTSCTDANVDTNCPPTVSCVAGGCFRGMPDCATAKAGVATFLYQASAIDGGQSCALTSTNSRRFASHVVVPPPPPQEIVEINQFGQYKTAVATPPGGKAPAASEETYNLMHNFYSVEVPENVHQCRHVTPPTCQ